MPRDELARRKPAMALIREGWRKRSLAAHVSGGPRVSTPTSQVAGILSDGAGKCRLREIVRRRLSTLGVLGLIDSTLTVAMGCGKASSPHGGPYVPASSRSWIRRYARRGRSACRLRNVDTARRE